MRRSEIVPLLSQEHTSQPLMQVHVEPTACDTPLSTHAAQPTSEQLTVPSAHVHWPPQGPLVQDAPLA
jgi:hypothetical protein